MNVRADAPADGHANMAQDAEMLRAAEQGDASARTYAWTGAWISLGRFQRPERGIPGIATIPYVIRPTGGKAVLHGHDVTVAIAMPLAILGCEGRSVRTVYRQIIAPLVDAMNDCDLPALLVHGSAYERRGTGTADCFAFASANDVVDPETGRKICGCALRITESAVLLQASIPERPPLLDPAQVFQMPSHSEVRHWNSAALADALRRRCERFV